MKRRTSSQRHPRQDSEISPAELEARARRIMEKARAKGRLQREPSWWEHEPVEVDDLPRADLD